MGGGIAPRAKPTDSISLPFGFGAKPPVRGEPGSVERRLYQDAFDFDFFQAVRLLEKLFPDRVPVGYDGPAALEVVRFQAHVALNFPPSQIFDIRYFDESRRPELSATFFGMSGLTGAMPRHYSELVLLAGARLEAPGAASAPRLVRPVHASTALALLSGLGKISLLYSLRAPAVRRASARPVHARALEHFRLGFGEAAASDSRAPARRASRKPRERDARPRR